MKKQRLLELDALRGLAAIAVLLYHYFYRYNKIYGHKGIAVDWSINGQYGVNLFFIISGFVIFWTLQRIDRPMDFIVSRFSRLYPVYWAAVFVTFSFVGYFGLPGREVECITAISNLMMFHQCFRIPHVDGVYWTLTVELLFYFWIFIIYLFKQLKNVELWLSVLIVVFCLKAIGIISVPVSINFVFIIDHINFFVAGICFYKIKNDMGNRLTWCVLILSLASKSADASVGLFVLYSMLYLVFFCAVSGFANFLKYKVFTFLGSISYPLYLVHQNIGYIVINKAYSLNISPIVGICIAAIVSISLAYGLTKFVEKPMTKFIRNYYRNSILAPKIKAVIP